MTVETTTDWEQYDTNGTTGPWTVPFYFLADGDVEVIYTDADGNDSDPLTLNVDYTITGAGDQAGGAVTTSTSYAAGGKITVRRVPSLLQQTNWVDGDPFPAASTEDAHDLHAMQAQYLLRILSRALLFPVTDSTDGVLPSATARANTQLLFDSQGKPYVAAPVSGTAADVLLQIANAADTPLGDALMGVKLTDAGAVATTQHAVNEAEPRNPKLHFGSPWDNTTTSAVGLQNAVTGALASGRGEVFLPGGNVIVDAKIELNDQASSGTYRQSVRILGAGKSRTAIIHRYAGPLFGHTLSQAQGDNEYFARGLEIGHLQILSDGSTPAGAIGISLQGVYYPHLHDLIISGLPGDCIQFPADARFAGPDHYSCADARIERCELTSSSGGFGIRNLCFSTAIRTQSLYVVGNAGGGYYLVGSRHEIDGGSCAGNGSLGSSAGLQFVRTSDGTPQECSVRHVEFDSNFGNHIITNGSNTRICDNRFKDDASGGAFNAPVAVRVVALTGQSADCNLIENNAFVLVNQGAANVTLVQFDLNSLDGRTVRYNVSRRNTLLASGATTGTVTRCDYGTNPTNNSSAGNRDYPPDLPEGTCVRGTLPSKNLADASTVQQVRGLGFRPKRIDFVGSSGNLAAIGFCVGNLGTSSNSSLYYYATGTAWNAGSGVCLTFRTAAGDIQSAYVSALVDDGFDLTWTKTGSPTGTGLVEYVATR